MYQPHDRPAPGRGVPSAPVSFDLTALVADRLGQNYALHEQYVNPTLVDVFRTIGFDRVYARGEGAYLDFTLQVLNPALCLHACRIAATHSQDSSAR